METLPIDIIIYHIFNRLSNLEKIKITSINKYFRKTLDHIFFDDEVNIDNIDPMSLFFEKLLRVSFSNLYSVKILPQNATHVKYGPINDIWKFPSLFDTNHNSTNIIDDFFLNNFKKIIPSTVRHLSFSHLFNKNIRGAIPNTITHLYLGYFFNQNLTNSLPQNLMYIRLSKKCYNYNKKCIPIHVVVETY